MLQRLTTSPAKSLAQTMPSVEREVKAWYKDLSTIGCIVCLNNGLYSPPEIHHLLDGGRRIGDLVSIPLCKLHHRGGFNRPEYVSRHPYKRAWEKRYGSEQDLFEQTKRLVNGLRGGNGYSRPSEAVHAEVQVPVRNDAAETIRPDTGKVVSGGDRFTKKAQG